MRRLPIFRPFTEEELQFMLQFKRGEMKISAGGEILAAKANSAHMFTVFSGWAFRYVLLPDGKRQILNFLLPGDFLGLQTSVFNVMEHSVAALTDVNLCVFQRSELWTLYEKYPSLAFDVTWLTAHEERLVDDSLATVGQRNARGRVAFLMLHLFQRLEGLTLTRKNSCPWPLTQQHVADTTGLSLVHTQRTLRWLIGKGLVGIDQDRLQISRREELAELALISQALERPRPIL